MEQQIQVPAGFWQKADGSLVPESMVKEIDKMRDELVRQQIEIAKQKSADLSDFKAQSFSEIAAFISLSADQYGAKIGGKKGNVTLMTFDGKYKIIRQMQETLVFDERLQAAKELIDRCINRWAEGSRDEIRVLVNDAFQVNQQGSIRTGRVLGLKRLAISDPEWLSAMQAITDSVQTAGSKPYLRFYERVGDSDEYRPISLDVAGV
ncbi:DUF3164 family protein [Hydrocarboniphaga effusa]|uniref:DUF3164 family protein n=1 Tax=Hydrocarboniphaga effusa TaxID=243629 RepID=UPI003BAD34CB